MKVLYIGSERSDAQAVANALRTVDEHVSVLWAAQLENAANWLGESRDLDALVMEAPIDGASCLVVQKQLRRLALPPTVVFLVPDGIAPTLDSLHPGAHYLRRNDTLSRELPFVVTHAIECAARADLEQQLARAAAARDDAEQRHQALAGQLAALQTQHEVGQARAAAAWDMVDEQLRTAALEVERARMREELAAAEVDRLAQREVDLSSQIADAAAAQSTLSRQLADAMAAADAAHARTEEERAAAAAELRAREHEFDTQLTQARDEQRSLDVQLAQVVVEKQGVEAQLAQTVNERSDAKRRHAAALIDVARLTARERELGQQITEVTASLGDLERRLAAEMEGARQREQLAAAEVDRLSQRESDLLSQLADAATSRSALARQLAEAQSEGDAANARTEHARTAAAAELQASTREFEAQLAQARDQHRSLEATLAQTVAERRGVEAQLAQTVSEREDGERRHAAAMNDIARLTAREIELTQQITDITASRSEIESQLAATQTAFDKATTQGTRERLAASRKAAEREAELDGQIHRERTARGALEKAFADASAERESFGQRLTDSEAALREARRDYQSALTNIERLTQHEANLVFQLTEMQGSRETLERQLTDSACALREARACEAALTETLQQERVARAALEQRIEDSETALDDAHRAHQSARAEIEGLGRRESNLQSELAGVQSAREALERQLVDAAAEAKAQEAEQAETLQRERSRGARLEQRITVTEAALEATRRDYQSGRSEVERLTTREANLQSELAGVQSARDTFERQLADATSDLREAREREAELGETLQQRQATNAALEQRIDEITAVLDEARRQHQSATADIEALTARGTDLTSQLAQTETALAQIRQDLQSASADVARLTQRETNLAAQVVELQATRHSLEHRLNDADTAIRDAAVRETELDEQVQHERTARTELEQTVTDMNATLRDAQEHHRAVLDVVADEREKLALRLGETDSALEQLRQKYTAASAELDRLIAREAELESQATDAQAIRATLEQTLADARARFVEQRQQLEIKLAHDQLEHESHSAEMDERIGVLANERDTLQQSVTALKERARQMQSSLSASVEAFEVSRAESHRLFDHASVAMFRCTRDGVLTDVNRALTTFIGRRTYELASADFATSVFEAPQALSWLIERCLRTKTKESIETTWRRQDGSRLFVRLSARSLPTEVIEFVAEDLTRLRVLEERLGQAQRMEALGRLASEVAVTCGSLLANIREQGREWVSQFPTHSDARTRGEELIDDVGRAVGFLQELAACGEEQARTPMLVDLNTLVRDLEPVLKNVVGGDVEVALSETSTPLNVDVGTERIERLLVNLASYGRGRMPSGGRLRIEIGTSVVDRHFSAKHPNVRLGLHALITVTESRQATREEDPESRQRKRKPSRAGVDFGTLQTLVSDCGGHLWMKVHPLGEMVAKIRLPLCSLQEQRVPRAIAARAGRGQAARWFQS